jgi:flagellar assembly protein FliH
MQHYRRYAFPPLANLIGGTTVPVAAAPALPAPFDSRLAEEALQAAREDSYEEGRAAGYSEAKSIVQFETKVALATLEEPLDALVAGFHSLLESYRREVRSEITGLVEKVARQVIRGELTQRPELLLEFVSEALATMPKVSEDVEVRLNAGEYERILAVAPDRIDAWRLTPDARLEPGECRVRVGDREMDAGCSQRLALCIERVSAHLRADELPRDIPPSGDEARDDE